MTNNPLYRFGTKARDMAGTAADAGLHIRRHADTPHAVMDGEGLHIAGRLPGHRRASSTDRCVIMTVKLCARPLRGSIRVNSWGPLRLGRQAEGTIE